MSGYPTNQELADKSGVSSRLFQKSDLSAGTASGNLSVLSTVNYFFSEGVVPPGKVPSNFRISPFRPTAQP